MKSRPYKIWLYGSLIVLFGLCIYPANIWWEWKQEQVAIEAFGIDEDPFSLDIPEKYGDLKDFLPEFLQVYLERCTFLTLIGAKITDEDIKPLSALSQLSILLLQGTKITDDGLKHLSNLSQLESLNLIGTKITDDGLKHLSNLSQLEYLPLRQTKITDEGLKHISGLSKLQVLVLSDTKVTDKGITVLLSGSINPKQLTLYTSKGQLSKPMIADLRKRGVKVHLE